MAIVREKAYIVFGPLPALPLMPLVAWLGEQTPDVLVLVLTALFGIWCFHRLLLTVHGGADRLRLACCALTFALGTAMHYGAPVANVWLHAEITATALQCWALWMAAAGRPWLCGIALGLTVLTRSTATLAAPLAFWMLARPGETGQQRAGHGALKIATAIGVPIAAAAALHAVYNFARFGSLTDAGYHYILMGDMFQSLVERYGRFHPHFLPHNLYGLLLRPPHLEDGRLMPDPHGMSVLLTTPFLLLLFVPRKLTRLERVALANVAVIALPSLLYYNDGWVQFGQRFALDWIAPGLLAASFGARSAPAWLVVAATAAGIAINAWGLFWFQANFLH